jgi:PEP-CTERM motif
MKQQVTLGKRAMKLALCATVAGAALAAQTAYAAVVTVDFTSNPFSTVPYNIDGFYINLVTGATATAGFAGYDINPYFSGSGGAGALFRFLTPATGGTVGSTVATPLAVGATVGPASTFASGVVNANSATPGISYFGLRFANEGTGVTNYGYLAVEQLANPPVAGSVRVLAYAYDDAGLALTVSAVPEPSAALLMLGGIAAFGAMRLRKTARENGAA